MPKHEQEGWRVWVNWGEARRAERSNPLAERSVVWTRPRDTEVDPWVRDDLGSKCTDQVADTAN